MKTIDINAKEWFDKVNGNSYHAGEVTVDFGMETEQKFTFPFQYGYGSQYETTAQKKLTEKGLLPKEICLWQWCRDNGVILRKNIVRNCKKRELKEFE